MFDPSQHDNINVIDPEDETRRSVDHEVAHAIQEWNNPDAVGNWDEDEAEGWQFEGRLSAPTDAQRKRLVDAWEAEHPDTSKVVHQFPDGWSIRQPQTKGDLHREGTLMNNCWQRQPPSEDQWNQPIFANQGEGPMYENQYYSLRDHNNHPRVSFGARFMDDEDAQIGKAFGHSNSDPKPEYLERIQQFADEMNTPFEHHWQELTGPIPAQIGEPQEIGPRQGVSVQWEPYGPYKEPVQTLDYQDRSKYFNQGENICPNTRLYKPNCSCPDCLKEMDAKPDQWTQHYAEREPYSVDKERAMWEEGPGDVEGMAKHIEWVPTEHLLPMREWNRTPGGTGGQSVIPERYEAIKQSILKNGFKNPVWVDYNPDTQMAHVSEGNHRLTIAHEAGIPAIPTRVYRSGRVPKDPSVLKGPYPYQGEGWIGQYMKPSEIGLPTTDPWTPKTP